MLKISYKKDIKIPVIASVDVLVVGGGPGGFSAAVMSARNGANTLLVERYGCLGGMAFHGEVTPFMPNHCNGKALDRLVYLEWCQKMLKYRPEEEQKANPPCPDFRMFPIAKEDVFRDGIHACRGIAFNRHVHDGKDKLCQGVAF